MYDANAPTVVTPGRGDGMLVALHDAEELLADVGSALHGAVLDKVLATPGRGAVGGAVGVVDGEQGQVVALGLVELGLLGVGLLGLVLGAVEDVAGREHGEDGEDLVAAAELDRVDQHLGRLGLDRQVAHLAAEAA